MVKDKPVKIYEEGYNKLKQYSELTGVPIKRVIAEMIEDWMDSVGQVRLEALTSMTIIASDLKPSVLAPVISISSAATNGMSN